MTLALISTETTEEPSCKASAAAPAPKGGAQIGARAARRPSELLQRDGAHDVAVAIPDDFELDFGGTLTQKRVIGRLHGKANAPLIVVAGGISADRYVHRTETKGLGWWSGAVGVRAPIDLTRFRVLAFDFAPEFGEGVKDAKTPLTITTQDQARLLALLLDHLGVEKVAAFIGCSYGGMIALAFGELFPDWAEQLVVVSAAHRPHPLATAWRGIQRRILQLGLETGRIDQAVGLARELAMTTYRTQEEFGDRFDSEAPSHAGQAYPVCDYLQARGRAYRDRTTPSRWLSLSDSIDRHRVEPEAISAPVTLIGFTTDRLCPIEDMRELADRLPNLWRFEQHASVYGHDAFLKEDKLVADILTSVLKDIDQ
ncbi:homoserine O-succinyltransferase MetX [Brevundimonas diminuta]|uniref:Homoserine O-succinyltransferase n=1 Tax=Brevundimonas diminuta TaxID=293 RepID=A0A1Z3LZN5_BREDI|nr:homoserine O-succinyltransferase [Brevundimonas diminuta]ASD27507.1 alpha/beta hydrolase [Brevundimonas diminuta]